MSKTVKREKSFKPKKLKEKKIKNFKHFLEELIEEEQEINRPPNRLKDIFNGE